MTISTQSGSSPKLLWATRYMGFTAQTPIQREAIPLALAGGDLVAAADASKRKMVTLRSSLMQRLRDAAPAASARCFSLQLVRARLK